MIIWIIWKYDQIEGSSDILRAFHDFEKAFTFLRNYNYERG